MGVLGGSRRKQRQDQRASVVEWSGGSGEYGLAVQVLNWAAC